MTENGSTITRAELNAHLEPMRDDIREVKSDVKALLVVVTATQAAKEDRRTRFSSIVAASSVVAILISGLTTALISHL